MESGLSNCFLLFSALKIFTKALIFWKKSSLGMIEGHKPYLDKPLYSLPEAGDAGVVAI